MPESTVHTEAADEIERLRTAFLRYLQHENDCSGRIGVCNAGNQCGCKAEMEAWCDDPATRINQASR